MSSLQYRLLRFIDEQLDEIHKRPAMWGPDIAVELQILQLLEFRSVVLRPALEAENPRAVLDAYEEFLARKFPDHPPVALASILARDERNNELTLFLQEFRHEQEEEVVPEDVFASHDLVLKLWLDATVTAPRASTLSSYYDVFRRVLRAISRPRGSRGRASQAIEDAIDFSMTDVGIFPANGVPAHIVLPLDRVAADGAAEVEEGIQRLVAVNDWATRRRAPVSELVDHLSGHEMAQHVAAQALRLMPSSAEQMQLVELGGKLIGRQETVRIEPKCAERMVGVVKQSTKLTEFDATGSIRAVDKDQCSMRFRLIPARPGLTTVQCWMENPHVFDKANKAQFENARIRVTGKYYKEPGSPALVVVDDVESLR